MSNGVVARRYGVALFQLAKEQHILDEASKQLEIIKNVFNENPQFLEILTHPKIDRQKKKALMEETFSTCLPPVQHALLLLLDRHRIAIVTEVIDHFLALYDEEKSVAKALVYSAKALSEDEKSSLSNTFSKKVNKKSLHIENIVDPSLIGGVKLRIGNRIYDGSVKGRLERVRSTLTKRS
ncbi:F0F1 ATP synthase subunit delta [Priestia endophytica]|jgi:F-type H+-transporting ATPase subunit delta|uniref:ATP synthase subunit delta n=1 Tax=Priestia endophytica TaxID=135735 RepID=A0AAX1Q7N1_9BACI|nr:F0F1 ATP synthase subunit delta [Priestia endophytica]RAS73066.1 F0F1 ATP synthase subunit delta [Priestia endophytica]RAS87415.1 F0F1 ATP synthase subunit delta [Priestia endophytica]